MGAQIIPLREGWPIQRAEKPDWQIRFEHRCAEIEARRHRPAASIVEDVTPANCLPIIERRPDAELDQLITQGRQSAINGGAIRHSEPPTKPSDHAPIGWRLDLIMLTAAIAATAGIGLGVWSLSWGVKLLHGGAP